MNTAPPEAQREARLAAWLAEYGDAVLRVCYVFLADRALAEDATQDTFVKAWRGMDHWKQASSPKTWLMRIAIKNVHHSRRSYP